MKFTATVEASGKTATGIEVPADVVEELGAGKRPPVRVTINGYTYRTSIGVMGGRCLIPVSADVRKAAGVAAGDELDVDLELDTAPRVLAVPADLAQAMDPDTRRFFDSLSYSRRQRFVLPIEQAKTPETRQRRIDKALTALRAGKSEP
ncbi:YdeI/OmpD-associated family protein [Actinocatenispora rupis]|uniref:Bacteriocin-protection, YdeI or OmpD-Associated n=1 Tax=Actinocatenispora rupis TaxID=519421 RepID=A0A8J3JD86_9ACTN|nr:YdeI/OmpD-associated family protein [Actinocatenispora rupis]GID16285.1 hypothetical protein Aru02nite_71740 [Actinocatenispora rupis]